jgi:hypothetical protein
MSHERTGRCPTCKRKMTRSTEANRRYWALMHVMADRWKVQGQQFSAEVWHMECKRRFLGCEEVKLPSGRTMLIPNSTALLDSEMFSDYMTKVEVWANEHNIYLEDAEA